MPLGATSDVHAVEALAPEVEVDEDHLLAGLAVGRREVGVGDQHDQVAGVVAIHRDGVGQPRQEIGHGALGIGRGQAQDDLALPGGRVPAHAGLRAPPPGRPGGRAPKLRRVAGYAHPWSIRAPLA